MKPVAGLPLDILEIVIDTLIHSMKPLPLVALATGENPEFKTDGLAVERHTFLDMCLVHRTWTDPSRRGLLQRAVLRPHNPIFRDISHNSQSSLPFQELALLGSGAPHTYLHDFMGVIRSSPKLRKLYLDVEYEEDACVSELLRQLSSCSHLENLWLVGEMEGRAQDVLLSISSLSRLKSLVLDTGTNFPNEINAVQQMDLPKSPKSVALIDTVDWPFLSRLLHTRVGHWSTNLHLTLQDPAQLGGDPDPVEQFNQYICLLETLSISSAFASRHSEHAIHKDSLHRILSRARSLRRFSLSATRLLVTFLQLPDTVTVFHFHHDDDTLDEYLEKDKHVLVEQDQNLASTVLVSRPFPSAKPARDSLREVILSFIRGKRDFDTDTLTLLENDIFAETYTACQLVGVGLTFKTYASRYFGPLAEEDPFI